MMNKIRVRELSCLLVLIAGLGLRQSASAQTTITSGNTFTIDDSNTSVSGGTTTFNNSGPITIYNDATLQCAPSQNTNIPFSNSIIFAGNGGTINLNFNDNDTNYVFNGLITSTATGGQSLAIATGNYGNGDRESVTFNSGIPNNSDGSALSLSVNFTTQTQSQSYVNLNAVNTFTGPITLVQGANSPTGYLTIGGVFTTNLGNTVGSGNLGNGNYAGTISLDTGTILNYYSTANQVLSGQISGPGSVMQSGPGLLTLTGNNTYTGQTTVSSGTLALGAGGSISQSTSIQLATGTTLDVTALGSGYHLASGQTLTGAGNFSVAGTITVDSGATVEPGGPSSAGQIGTLSVGALTLNPGSISNFKFNGSNNDLINVASSDGLVINGGGVGLYESGSTQPFAALGTYDLMQYSGAAPSTGDLSVVDPISGFRYAFSTVSKGGNNYVALVIGAGPTWTGGVDNKWSTAANWTNGPIQANDRLVFDGNAHLANTNDTNISQFASMVFNPTAGNAGTGFTISGNAIILSGDSDGYLIYNQAPGVTQTINLPITVGAAGKTITTSSPTGTTVLNGAINNNGNTLLFTGSGNTTIGAAGGISGSGGLTMTGNGTLTLAGSNSYTGTTTLASGSLAFSGASGTIAQLVVTGGTVAAGTGATVATADFSAPAGTVITSGPLAITTQLNLRDGYTASYTPGGSAKSFTMSSVGSSNIADNSAVRTIGLAGGTLKLSLPGYQPGLDVRAWQGFNSDGSLNNSSNGAVIDGPLFNLANPTPPPNNSTFAGTLGYATGSIDFNLGGAEHFAGNPGSGVLTGPMPTGYVDNYAVEYRGELYVPTSGQYSFATTSDDGSALWVDPGTVNPSESQTVVDNNYYQGPTQATSAGPISLSAGYHDFIVRYYQGGGGNALDVQWDPTGGTNFVDIPGTDFFHGSGITAVSLPNTNIALTASSVLDLGSSSDNHVLGDLTLSGNGTQLTLLNANSVTFNSITATANTSISTAVPIALASGNVTVSGGNTLQVDANIVDGATPTALNKLGGGVLLLTGSNTYTGATNVNQGTLALGAAASLASPAINVASSGTLDVSLQNATPFAVPAGATLANNGTVLGNVSAPAGTILSGTGSFLQGGTGPYSVTVAGTIQPSGTMTIGSGSNNVGLVLQDSSTYAWGATSAASGGLVQVNGNLSIGNNVQVIPVAAGGDPTGQTYTIMTWSGPDPANNLVMGTAPPPASGPFHWTGGPTGNWDNGFGWDHVSFSGGTITKVGKSFQISGLTATAATPGASDDVIIAPAGGAAVTGPSAAAAVNSLTLGNGSDATSLSLQSAGPLTVTNAATLNNNTTLNGPGTLSAGILSVPSGSATLGGGVTVLAPTVAVNGTLNFNNGTLKATQDMSSLTSGSGNLVVTTGGATVDSNGHAVTISQALLHDPALGSALDGGLTVQGAGTVVVSATQLYTGVTNVINGGTLRLQGTGGGGAVGTTSWVGTGSPGTAAGPASLIYGLAPTAESNGALNAEGTAGNSVLTDGVVPSTFDVSTTYAMGSNGSLTYTLPASATGYSISNVNVFAQWRDTGRSETTISNIAYSTISANDIHSHRRDQRGLPEWQPE